MVVSPGSSGSREHGGGAATPAPHHLPHHLLHRLPGGQPVSVVVINALDVPEGGGAEIERRFAARRHSVDGAPGFEGFQLLRPVAGESRW